MRLNYTLHARRRCRGKNGAKFELLSACRSIIVLMGQRVMYSILEQRAEDDWLTLAAIQG